MEVEKSWRPYGSDMDERPIWTLDLRLSGRLFSCLSSPSPCLSCSSSLPFPLLILLIFSPLPLAHLGLTGCSALCFHLHPSAMSLQSKFDQLRSRVGEFKDKLADRQKRPSFLEDDDQLLENEVMGMRDGFQVLLKKEHEYHPVEDRKIPLWALGSKMMQTGKEIGDATPFGAFYTKVGRLQLDLGQLQLIHNRTLHQVVHDPVRGAIQEEYPKLVQLRKKLQAQHTDLESATAKFTQTCAKVHKQGYSGNATKVDASRDELEQAQAGFQSCKTQYVEDLINIASKDKEFIEPLLNMVEEQLKFHESACELLRSALPSLREMKTTAGQRKVFGLPLPDEGVDGVIAQLAAVINRDGLESQGLFRLAGSAVRIRQLKADINSGRADFKTREGYGCDINAVANTFKLYLREMPEPLLTFDLYPGWIAIGRMQDHNDKLYAIQATLQKLPKPNYTTLRFLARFLHNVSLHSEKTKMEASNLGIVIGPNLGWPTDYETNAMYSATDSGPLSGLCEAFITYHEWLFPVTEDELPGTITDPYDVPNISIAAPRKRPSSYRPLSSGSTTPISSKPPPPPPPSSSAKPALVQDDDGKYEASEDASGRDTSTPNGDHLQEMPSDTNSQPDRTLKPALPEKQQKPQLPSRPKPPVLVRILLHHT
eukprot:m.190384 g.190384  ORF g.190384 m.190384 type:complete len:654 (-) comp16757_c0_seq1:3912-5873(-)